MSVRERVTLKLEDGTVLAEGLVPLHRELRPFTEWLRLQHQDIPLATVERNKHRYERIA